MIKNVTKHSERKLFNTFDAVAIWNVKYIGQFLKEISDYYNKFITILQLKLLASLKGSSYQPGQVTDEELQDKLDELKTGMLMAFNYAQGTEYKSQIFIIIS